jgi:ketosteroid isomerase-like protein
LAWKAQLLRETLRGRCQRRTSSCLCRLIDAWNRHDVEATFALTDPEGVWFPSLEGIIEGRTYRGPAGMREYFEELAKFAEEGHTKVSEVHDLGDQVLILGRIWLRFAGGPELDQEGAVLHTWRNGECVEGRTWLSHAEALEAAGLGE